MALNDDKNAISKTLILRIAFSTIIRIVDHFLTSVQLMEITTNFNAEE